MGRLLLLKVLPGWSYYETYAMLEALPDLAGILGFEKGVPAASTVADLVDKIPIP